MRRLGSEHLPTIIKNLGPILFLAASGLLSAAEEKPNIVFLLVDDLGCYDAEFYETPEGKSDDAISAPAL